MFSRGRGFFWALAPFLLAFGIGLPLMQEEWTSLAGGVVGMLSVAAFLLLILLYDPARFLWAGRALGLIVFLFYVAYFVSEVTNPSSPGGFSWLGALLGLIAFGAPAIFFAGVGRFWWTQRGDPGEG